MNPYLPRALELAQRQDRPERVCALCHMALISWFKGHYQSTVASRAKGRS